MLDLITGTLYAIPPSGGGGGDQPFWVQLAPLALIVLVFYFLLIRPQQKKAKQQREMIASLNCRWNLWDYQQHQQIGFFFSGTITS